VTEVPPMFTLARRVGSTSLSALVLVCASLFAIAQPAHAQGTAQGTPQGERLTVADPFLELHTGPGRGYPVTHVAEREEWVEIELRHTDWYKVRTASGKAGWVHRRQLQATITQAGGRKTFRDTLLDDYLRRRVEAGAAWGQFSREPMLKAVGAFRFTDTLVLEGSLGQVQGLYSGSDFWHVNLIVEPWSDRRLSPYAGVGFGAFHNIPNDSLVGAKTTDAKLANAVVGLRWHLSERFMVRADYTLHTAFVAQTRSAEYRAVTLGLSFFF
jgi:uncharacterized protein YraI